MAPMGTWRFWVRLENGGVLADRPREAVGPTPTSCRRERGLAQVGTVHLLPLSRTFGQSHLAITWIPYKIRFFLSLDKDHHPRGTNV
jgi:hypothetical protein